jgi:diguanylate cyclase
LSGFWLPTSLRARLLALVLLAALPAIVAVIFAAATQREHALTRAQADVLAHAERLLREVSEARAAAVQLLHSISVLPAIRAGDPAACAETFAQLLGRGGQFRNIGLIDVQGRVLCAAHPASVGANSSDRRYFTRALETKAFAVGDFQIGLVAQEGSINFALPLLDSTDSLRGVVYASLTLTSLTRSLFAKTLPAQSQVTLLDPKFTIVERLPRDAWVGKNIAGTAMQRLITGQGAGPVEPSPGLVEQRHIYTVTPALHDSGEVQGYVVISVPDAVVSGPVNRALARQLGLVALIVAAIVVIAMIGSNLLVLRRLGPILAATRRISAGDFTARTPAAKDDNEFSVLENAFNEMAARIETNVQHISGLNRTYAVLTDINGAIFRIRDSQALIDEACRVAVETGGFAAACIHLAEEGAAQARLAGHAGASRKYFEGIVAQLHEPVRPDSGPITRALKTGRPVVEQDVEVQAGGAWRERVKNLGARSVAAFPLSFGGKLKGAFGLYAREAHAFDEQEVRLFVQLAADTSLGLEMAEKETRLYHLTNYDLITGLPNRALFEDRVSQALVRAPRAHTVAAVLLLRVERFRQINDRFGWAGCDAAVKHISQFLAKLVRPGDTVARVGDDQFGILLDDVRRVEDIVATADRLITGYPRAVTWSGEEILLQGSMGIAAYPNDGEDAESLMRNAQVALDNITTRRGNAFAFYASDLDRKAHARHLIESHLAHAIERGELSIAYQPLVRIHDRQVTGAEALLRWENRTLGEVAPSSFVSIAEQVGLIAAIGTWVFETTCDQRMGWRQYGSDDFRISANVSVHQLRQPDFLAGVEQILNRTGLNPRQVAFGVELTETELMEHIDRMVPILRTLRSFGVYLSIDDFGTGYSSLSYLWRLPVDALKIDLSFVRDIVTDENAQNVAASIVTLGHSLNLHVVAEGVETEEQFAVLDAMGCDSAQGFLFSHPVPADAFEKFLKR